MSDLLIGKGRAADVFALGEGRVVRRYRQPRNVEIEARVMEHARAHGVPVPRVFEAGGSAIEYQGLVGGEAAAIRALIAKEGVA